MEGGPGPTHSRVEDGNVQVRCSKPANEASRLSFCACPKLSHGSTLFTSLGLLVL